MPNPPVLPPPDPSSSHEKAALLLRFDTPEKRKKGIHIMFRDGYKSIPQQGILIIDRKDRIRIRYQPASKRKGYCSHFAFANNTFVFYTEQYGKQTPPHVFSTWWFDGDPEPPRFR